MGGKGQYETPAPGYGSPLTAWSRGIETIPKKHTERLSYFK